MKKISILVAATLCLMIYACNDEGSGTAKSDSPTAAETPAATPPADGTASLSEYDPHRGEGKYNADNVPKGPVDGAMVKLGDNIYTTKCASCHKLTDEKLVGPGWKGVSQRHKPEWIMNFITNPDPMLDNDPKLQEQLEICMVRMPNQDIQEKDALALLDFMRKNDGAK